MPTVVDTDVGSTDGGTTTASGRDEAHFDDWEALTDINIGSGGTDEQHNGNFFHDRTVAGPAFDHSSLARFQGGSGLDATHFRRAQAATDALVHDASVDTMNDGIVFNKNSGGGQVLLISDEFTEVIGITLHQNVSGSSNMRGLDVGTGGDDAYIHRCTVYHDTSTSGFNQHCFHAGAARPTFATCLAIGGADGTGAFSGFNLNSTSIAVHCIASTIRQHATNSIGFNGQSGTVIRNCGTYDIRGTSRGYLGSGDEDYNVSEEGSASGSNSHANITVADEWTDAANQDFTVVAGGVVQNGGVHRGSDYNGSYHDMIGNTFGGNGAPDIGIFERQSAAPFIHSRRTNVHLRR